MEMVLKLFASQEAAHLPIPLVSPEKESCRLESVFGSVSGQPFLSSPLKLITSFCPFAVLRSVQFCLASSCNSLWIPAFSAVQQ